MSKTALLLALCLLTSCGTVTNEIDLPSETVQEETIVEEEKTVEEAIPEEPEEEPVNEEPKKVETPKVVEAPSKAEDNNLTGLSNKKLAWYFIKAKDHAKSGIGSELKAVVDKYGAIYLDDTEEKVIFLTFDEGYENGYTGQILDTLKEYGVKATFFITGPYLDKQQDLIKRMIDEGHTVGNHTVNHPSMPSITDDEKLEKELLDLDRKFFDIYGVSMKYLRPPMGEFSERTLALAKNLGYTSVFWSFAYRDWETDNQKGTDYALNTVINSLHPGEVLLLHAVSKDNANALPRIIEKAREMGYTFGELR
ncbi:MAG: delta-lactam-biosynthetic de-N-acetylase [Clostridia bacterium]|nr:delta-lactam-biosynthetic de-N-acetylase [Clostridia bacterium]